MNIIAADILIAGAGAAGLATALALSDRGFKIHVLEKQPENSLKDQSKDGRTAALWLSSLQFLEKIGLREDLEKSCEPIRGLSIHDMSSPPLEVHAHEMGEDILGLNVPGALLREVLLKKIALRKNIQLHFGESLEFLSTSSSGVFAKTHSHEFYGKMMIAADGKNSTAREIAGIRTLETDYRQDALVFTVSHEKPHKGISHEHYHPGGPVTFVPLPGHASSIVYVDWRENIEEIVKVSKAELAGILSQKSSERFGQITVISDPVRYPLKRLRAKKLVQNRLILMAEAAHAVHPLGAQGLNLSLRDAMDLARLFKSPEDLDDLALFKRYALRRYGDTQLRLLSTHAMVRAVSFLPVPLRRLRPKALQAIGACRPLKNMLARVALAA